MLGYSYSASEFAASPAVAKMALITMPAGENQIIAIYNTVGMSLCFILYLYLNILFSGFQ
jgi:hypothetical protein